jgi:hypothetical protein
LLLGMTMAEAVEMLNATEYKVGTTLDGQM